MNASINAPLPPLVLISEIAAQARQASALVKDARQTMLAPEAKKSPPVYNLSQLAELLGVDKGSIAHRAKAGDLPGGTLNSAGTRREFTLAEARQWARALKAPAQRPQGCEAVVITTTNFKGGVGKTTSAMALAQGLSLRGHRVLAIDADPQASFTTLFGVLPDVDVEDDRTLMPLMTGDQSLIEYAVRKTYWDGIDLVASAPSLYGAEFVLPARQAQDRSFEFWRVLELGLVAAKGEYDIILIDTPPSLSYVTINALMAADGLVMPVLPGMLDFSSSVLFWGLYTEFATELKASTGFDKQYEFVDIFLSRVDSQDSAVRAVRGWIQRAYGVRVLPVEIPKTAATGTAAATFGTLFDLGANDVSAKTLKRARDAYALLIDHIEGQVQTAWQRQLQTWVRPGTKAAGAVTSA